MQHDLPNGRKPDMTETSSVDRNSSVAVQLINIKKSFGPVRALAGLNLDIHQGELVALLGPSGCGKTTALRALAGLQNLDSGQILVDGKDITYQASNHRGMGMVFQAYSLFPHMSARANVEYGLTLRAHKINFTERKKRSTELLELVGLASHANHFPHQMSGGQQQRVALARALAISPKVLLLDEPLSALDAKVRTQLRDEIRRIQLEVGTTTLFVTHDQEEALGIADRVGVMKDGELQQIAVPAKLYDHPTSAFVAEFVGLTNPIKGTVKDGMIEILGMKVPILPGSIESGSAIALARPETLRVLNNPNGKARVLTASFLGSSCRVIVILPDGSRVTAQIPSSESYNFQVGASVDLTLNPVPVFAKAAS
jgi:putative spermidine/putrescine transport system ATP-binding protein